MAEAFVKKSERRALRATYLVLAYLFLVALLVQTYLAGLGIFGGSFGPHALFGYAGVHGVAMLMVLTSFFARLGRTLVWTTVLTFVVAFLMPLLATMDSRAVAALHPAVAVLLVGAGLFLAVRTRVLVPRPIGSALPAGKGTAPRAAKASA